MCLPSRSLVPPLSPNVSHSLPTCVPVLAFLMSCLPLPPIVSHCPPTSVPVLDGASAFPTCCLPFLSPIVSPHVCLWWKGGRTIQERETRREMGDNGRRQGETRPWEGGHTIQHKRILWGDNGETRPREGGHAIQHRHTCGETVGDNRRQGRDQRRQSHCLPACVPVLDGVSVFPKSYLPLSPIVSPNGVSAFPTSCFRIVSHCSPHVCLCWMVCPPSRGLVSPCLPSCLSLSLVVSNCLATCACVGWSTFPKSCSSLSLIVSLGP